MPTGEAWSLLRPQDRKPGGHRWSPAVPLTEHAASSRGGDHDLLEAFFNDEQAKRHHEVHHDAAAKFVWDDTLGLIEAEVPPSLDASLQVRNVASSWRSDAEERHQAEQNICQD